MYACVCVSRPGILSFLCNKLCESRSCVSTWFLCACCCLVDPLTFVDDFLNISYWNLVAEVVLLRVLLVHWWFAIAGVMASNNIKSSLSQVVWNLFICSLHFVRICRNAIFMRVLNFPLFCINKMFATTLNYGMPQASIGNFMKVEKLHR